MGKNQDVKQDAKPEDEKAVGWYRCKVETTKSLFWDGEIWRYKNGTEAKVLSCENYIAK